MPLRDHLEPEESILARCDPFYATSRRVLRYQITKDGEQAVGLPYSRVQGVELVRKPQHRLMVAGTLMGAAGAFLFFYLGFITSIPTFIFGLGLIIYGGQGKEAYYQLHLYQMTKQEGEIWRIRFRGSADFIVKVGEQSGRRLIES